MAGFLKRTVIGVFVISGLVNMALAQTVGSDRRIKMFLYSPNAVYHLTGKYETSLHVLFSENEKVSFISLGKSDAWSVAPTDDNSIFLKPRLQTTKTNMQVITKLPEGEKRYYNFDLTSQPETDESKIIYKVSFRYPQDEYKENEKRTAQRLLDEKRQVLKDFKSGKTTSRGPVSGASSGGSKTIVSVSRNQSGKRNSRKLRYRRGYNYDYAASGSKFLFPTRVYDDGKQTVFEFGRMQGVPAIFKVGPAGKESLMPVVIKGDKVFVRAVARLFRIRYNGQLACVYNLVRQLNYPRDNTKTTSPEVKRIIKQ